MGRTTSDRQLGADDLRCPEHDGAEHDAVAVAATRALDCRVRARHQLPGRGLARCAGRADCRKLARSVLYINTGMLDVVVVGGGVIGSSIAYHLARSGARVRVYEQSEP